MGQDGGKLNQFFFNRTEFRLTEILVTNILMKKKLIDPKTAEHLTITQLAKKLNLTVGAIYKRLNAYEKGQLRYHQIFYPAEEKPPQPPKKKVRVKYPRLTFQYCSETNSYTAYFGFAVICEGILAVEDGWEIEGKGHFGVKSNRKDLILGLFLTPKLGKKKLLVVTKLNIFSPYSVIQ
ncbi:hypothetical protein HC928_04530 [bacterium]|nr:hypothetical protein [bacterium]